MKALSLPEILPAALIAAALALPGLANADMYKWVDDKGVVTYSNTPPPATSAKKVEEVADRVSVYTPDAGINHAMSEQGQREARKASLGRQLEAERNRNKRAAAATSVADRRKLEYERCRAEHRVECEAILNGTEGDATYGYIGYYPRHVVGAAASPPVPFRYLDVPDTRVGINNAPPVGISTAPRVGIDDRPPVGAPSRPSRSPTSRLR